MIVVQWFLRFFLAFSMVFGAYGNDGFNRDPRPVVYQTFYVDQSGHGNFSTIQSAIDNVPSNNRHWICIYIKAGTYRERISIPLDRPYIFLKGEGKRKTSVVWSAGDSITSATFTCEADNVVAKSISFVNSFNYPSQTTDNPRQPAVAAMLVGDKLAFYRCGFLGLQDTLWDVQGRHYFKLCTIQGAVDFIFGAGQSLYERCTLFVTAGDLQGPGFITAQGRSRPEDFNGFVFKECNVIGTGQAYLGRPWREYATVIFYNTSMSDVVVPQGWTSWDNVGREYKLTYVEKDCWGSGANSRDRVSWQTKLSNQMVSEFASMSFIDQDDWISKQVFNMS